MKIQKRRSFTNNYNIYMKCIQSKLYMYKTSTFHYQIRYLNQIYGILFFYRLNLLKKVMTFFSDWNVDNCEENMVTFSFRSLSPKQKKAVHNKHQQKPAKELMYRLQVSINFKSFVVENVQVGKLFYFMISFSNPKL
jgi:hypothetical protein